MPSFIKSLIVEQFQGNYLKGNVHALISVAGLSILSCTLSECAHLWLVAFDGLYDLELIQKRKKHLTSVPIQDVTRITLE